jgi:hypothetical protein
MPAMSAKRNGKRGLFITNRYFTQKLPLCQKKEKEKPYNIAKDMSRTVERDLCMIYA